MVKLDHAMGDRVCLKPGHRHPEFLPGCRGTIAAVLPAANRIGQAIYQVRMDDESTPLHSIFYADELEPLRRRGVHHGWSDIRRWFLLSAQGRVASTAEADLFPPSLA
jgi:hypothetical protein